MFSCGNEKSVQLPKIGQSQITEIKDVSPAYLFYDETKPDSVELNRKNLISTTNWLVNADKRLTLKQVIPHIKFLQDKKKNSSHKKEGVKNYFTCNDTVNKNLGFIEFTDVNYHLESSEEYLSKLSTLEDSNNSIAIGFDNNGDITIVSTVLKSVLLKTKKDSLVNNLKKCDTTNGIIFLSFHKNLKYQDYITYKSLISNIKFKETKLSIHEFLFN